MIRKPTVVDTGILPQLLDGVPMLPETAFSVMEMMHKPDTDPSALARVVAQDPGLTVQTLHLCNSPFYSLPVEVVSIEHAVRLLGVPTVCGIVMAAYVHGFMARFSGEGARLWLRGARRHVLTVPDGAQHLAACCPVGISKSEAFTVGLLHDIGKLVLAQLDEATARAVEQRAAVPDTLLVDAEWDVLGTDHAEAGFLLAQRWGLPELIAEVIRWHHRPQKTEEALALLVFLANQLAHVQEGRTRLQALLDQDPLLFLVEDRLGLGRKDFSDIAEAWLQRAHERDKRPRDAKTM
ncbi:HDOD domain-containing protein [Desulfosoma sp.]